MSQCFVAVAYQDQDDTRVLLVRSYPLPLRTDSIPPGHQWTIMDAAMATTAAPTYIQSHSITREGRCFTFEDAGRHGANNPTEKAWAELQSDCFPSVAGSNCFVSIGTGGKGTGNDSQKPPQQGPVRQVLTNMFNLRLRVTELSKGLVNQAEGTDSEEIDEKMRSHTDGTDKYVLYNS